MNTDQDTTRTETDAALEAGRIAAGHVHTLTPGRYHALPTPNGIQLVDLTGDQFAPCPKRIRQTVALHHTDALLSYWTKHATTGLSELYANRDNRTITAIIDANEDNTGEPEFRPGWNQHRAVLTLELHDAFKAWTSKDGTFPDQEPFVDFLDENATWIADPTPAVLIQIVRELRASVGAEFEAAYDPATGARTLGYRQEIKTRTVNGDIDLPESFLLRLPVWRGSPDTVEVTAKLRTRISNTNALRIGYKLINLTELIDAAFAAEVARIAEATGQQVWHGIAPGPAA